MLSKITRYDPLFPVLLTQIPDCPAFLYIRGVLPPTDMPLLTVVGTRRVSPYGLRAVEHILRPLVRRGFGIISGLAFGVDARAHEVALENGGYTAAVLGSGLNQVTPGSHEPLARRIVAAGGAIISELEPDEPIPHKGAFHRRNRILAGLSPMTLVIEAAEKSGAQITAHQAAEYGRDVGAMPGSIFSHVSAGCHALLKKGAYPVTSAQDILEAYRLSLEVVQPTLPMLSADEQTVWQQLTKEPQPIDVLSGKLSFALPRLLTILTQLELKEVIAKIPGQGYVKT